MLQRMTMETVFNFPIPKIYIYNDYNIFVLSWWSTDSYFNNKLIQIGDIEIMTYEYGSPGSFGSRVGSTYIIHNTYTGRRGHLCSKPTSIHGLVQKYDFNYSYSRIHFSRLPKAVANIYIACLIKLVVILRQLIRLLMDLLPMMYQVICTYFTTQ